MLETSILAVFLTGLLGGVHCAGMCGGIVAAMGMSRDRLADSSTQKLSVTSVITLQNPVLRQKSQATSRANSVYLFNLGRITTYVLLGAMAGSIGSIGWWMQSALPVQQTAFLITNLLLIVIGLYLGGIGRIGFWIESLGQGIWRYIKPLATQRMSGIGSVNAVLAGSLWGMVPCGMVYTVLMAALVSGSGLNGASLMLAFGLGTLPNLLLLGFSTRWLQRLRSNILFRRSAAAIIIGFGVIGLMRMGVASDLPIIKELCVHLPIALQ